MEAQQTFNEMMENAIVYLQSKGLIPSQQKQQSESDMSNEQITKILKDRGLLPRK